MNLSDRNVILVSFKRFLVLGGVIFSLSQVNVPAIMAQEENVQAGGAVAQEEVVPKPVVAPVVEGASAAWDTLSHEQKVEMITATITKFKADKKITIRKEPAFYVDQIDAIRADNPTLGDESVGSIFRTLAIAYRDFRNGQDPEELIRTELGEEMYQKTFKNKEALEAIYQEYLKENSK